MRLIIYCILAVFLSVTATTSSAEVLRCKGTSPYKIAGEPISIEITVIPPDEDDEKFTLALYQDAEFEEFVNILNKIQKAVVVITESVGEGKTKASKDYKYNFLTTQRGNEKGGWSYVGYNITGSTIFTLKIDVWEKGKPFYLYGTDFNEMTTGQCE